MGRTRGPIGPAVFADDWALTVIGDSYPEEAVPKVKRILQEAIEARTPRWDPDAQTYDFRGFRYKIWRDGLDEIVGIVRVGRSDSDDEVDDLVTPPPLMGNSDFVNENILGSW